MPRFFVPQRDIDLSENMITVRGDDAAHITKVLRMRVGENVTVCDMAGCEYLTEFVSGGALVSLRIISSKMSENEPPYKLTVFQSLVRGDRFDTVLQKSTELGAYAIVPVITSRCTVKLEMGSADCRKKLERWQRIVYEAAKQCGRGIIPTVYPPMRFSDAVCEAAKCDVPLFCYEGDGTLPLIEQLKHQSPDTISVMIGPEGGYSLEESEEAGSSGMLMTGLGKRILRTETAPAFVLSCVSYRYELH